MVVTANVRRVSNFVLLTVQTDAETIYSLFVDIILNTYDYTVLFYEVLE